MKKKYQGGFTLLEMMIAFSVFSIVILVLYATFYTELKNYFYRFSMITMNIESQYAMNHLKNEINRNGLITVSDSIVYANGTPIIDGNNDLILEGSRVNLDESRHVLLDESGASICEHVKSLQFLVGPTIFKGIGITDNMLLIEIVLEDRDAMYTIHGGVNLAR